MASLASAVQKAVTPKKRSYADFSGNSETLPSPTRRRGHDSVTNSPQIAQNGASDTDASNSQITGLEPVLDLNIPFIEATESTANHETRFHFLDSSSNFDLDERRRMADELSNLLPVDAQQGRGLPNITGTLCYRNSLFQALLHTPKFVNWLIEHHQPEHCVSDDVNTCISCHLRKLCVLYWATRNVHVDSLIRKQLIRINSALKRAGWHPHSDNGHGDPDDQLGWILERMRYEMPNRAYRYFEAFHVSVLESEIICDDCGHVSKTGGNSERHFPLPIKSRTPRQRITQLSGLMDAYMDEIIDEYRCEKEGCGSTAQKHRLQKIVYAPDVLLVQLKRFSWYGAKDCTKVSICEKLSLTEYAAHKDMGPLDYELVGVICHQGTVGFGHYICVSRTDTEAHSNNWSEYDDVSVCKASAASALNPSKAIGREWTPYLLFYKRIEEKPENENIKHAE